MLSHQLVTAYGTAPDRADDEIKLGGMDNVDVSVYDAFDYVALGHVHRPQRVGARHRALFGFAAEVLVQRSPLWQERGAD